MLGPVELVDEVDSTNRVLLDRARTGAPHGLVLVANHQTAGRGRLDRRWEAERGTALLVSVLLRPALPASRLHLVTIAAAVAVIDTCSEVGAGSARLKWPNDVIAGPDERKLAGLLGESIIERGTGSAAVVGLGLNLCSGQLPAGALALDELLVSVPSRDVVLDVWLSRFDQRLSDLDAPSLIAAYRECCSTIGKRVRVDVPGGEVEGLARGVDDAGRLIVEVEGVSKSFAVGDVIHVREVLRR